MLDIIEYLEEKQMSELIVSLDFKKCFDPVEDKSVYQAIRYFNFGKNLVKWVKIVLEGFLICTKNTGFVSEWILLQKAIFQGAPTSPYLYLLLGHILSDRSLENHNNKPIMVQGEPVLLSQYSDDTDIT